MDHPIYILILAVIKCEEHLFALLCRGGVKRRKEIVGKSEAGNKKGYAARSRL